MQHQAPFSTDPSLSELDNDIRYEMSKLGTGDRIRGMSDDKYDLLSESTKSLIERKSVRVAYGNQHMCSNWDNYNYYKK
jgi:hypothetical protein